MISKFVLDSFKIKGISIKILYQSDISQHNGVCLLVTLQCVNSLSTQISAGSLEV